MLGVFVKSLMKSRLKRLASLERAISRDEIERSSKCLFAVFSRYGDAIASFKVINEFIAMYPEKAFFVVTSPQLSPYAKAIVAGTRDLLCLSPRRNPTKFLQLIRRLEREQIDLGFNPQSRGIDTEFFLTYARRFSFFREASREPVQHNLYDRVREYLSMPKKEIGFRARPLEVASNVVIAPSSTDIRKSLGQRDLASLVRQLRERFSSPHITVALPSQDWDLIEGVDKFRLAKSLANSESFLRLVKSADLFVGVDAGPLHLADALGVRSIGVFGPYAPETFMDRDSGIIPIRDARMGGVFCLLHGCRNPVCIHRLFHGSFLDKTTSVAYERNFVLEEKECRAA
jgi:ADP-heptose:LPS heptosyltransferase